MSHDALPRDARLIALLLSSTPAIEDAQPAVLQQLLEFAHRYTAQVLGDALVYADHAGRSGSVQMDDVTLAVQSRVGWEFGGRVPKEHLLSLAARTNSEPLPIISETYGVRLPPAAHCLTAVDFDLIPNKPPPQDVYNDEPEDEEEDEDEDEEDDAMDEDPIVLNTGEATPATDALGLSSAVRMSDDEGEAPAGEEEAGSDEDSGDGDGLFDDDGEDDDDEEMDIVEGQTQIVSAAPTPSAAPTTNGDPQVGEKRKLSEDDEYD